MKTREHQYSHHISVPSDEGTKVEETITIYRPVAEVYDFWRRLENLPRFMRHLQSVTERDGLHSHWVIRALSGQTVEWDAEIIERRENEMISWRSTPGSDVGHAGSVWFTPVAGGQATRLRIDLNYVPPGGKAGAMLGKMFGQDAASEIAEDLLRLKRLLETGEQAEEGLGDNWSTRAMAAGRRAAGVTDDYVHENAWIVIGSVAFGCLLLGFSLGQASRTPYGVRHFRLRRK
jgi:uncharacterized membrane protein